LVVVPLTVHIFSVCEVEEGGPLESVAVPMRGMEGEIVIEEDAWSVALALGVERSLIFAVTVVYYFHFNTISRLTVQQSSSSSS
jgi:hypothetical protein